MRSILTLETYATSPIAPAPGRGAAQSRFISSWCVRPRARPVDVRVVEGRQPVEEGDFEGRAPIERTARQHAPGAGPAAQVLRARQAIDRITQFLAAVH